MIFLFNTIYTSFLILFIFIVILFYNRTDMKYILVFFIIVYVIILYIYYLFYYKEPIFILCEEKKTKIFLYTYKFGILKYLIADKNEIGSTIFSILNKENNQVLIPTGYLTGKKGWDSILFDTLTNGIFGIQYKNKLIDYSILPEKKFNSKVTDLFKEFLYCDQLIIDTSESNVLLLDKKIKTDYQKFNNKLILYNSDEFLKSKNVTVVEESLNLNNKMLEDLIIEKNNKAEQILREINEVGEDPQFHEIGNWEKHYWEDGKKGPYMGNESRYVKIHKAANKIINETVANQILKIKK